MKKRILLTYAMYGNGHRAVAQYIESYFKAQDPELEILAIDLIGVVPDDQSVIVATNKGEPAVTDNKSFAGSSYRNIVRRIMGEEVPFEDGKRHGLMDKIKSLLMKKK